MQTLDTLEQLVRICKKCPLSDTRTHSVFGEGPANPTVLFVGEAPGEEEDLKGVPFVGKSGALLSRILEAAEIPRETVYITNIVKCRPPDNRDPSLEEREACLPYLRSQFKALNPRIVVALGRIAATTLIYPDFKITKNHGQWVTKGDTLFMGTFHPAALLRNPAYKKAAWEDFKALKKQLDLLASQERNPL